MKRYGAWLGVVAMMLTLTACSACGMAEEPPTSDGGATAVGHKLGMGSVSAVSMEGTEQAHVKVTAAALVLDTSGKIASCEIDELAFTVAMKDGLPQAAENLLSMLDMGDDDLPDTGSADTATKPWHEQAEAFCDYAEGKTPDQITGLATTDGKSEEIEGCDLILTDIIQAVGRAAKAARAQSVKAGDDLELAMTATKAEGSTNEKPQYDVELAAVTVGSGDRITGCITDTLQAKLTVAEGVFSTLSGGMETKRQMGDGYGMKAASSINREWYEQANAFDTFAVGKTAEELAGTKLNSEGKTDAVTGCTMAVTGMLKNAVKAADKE
ncbi:MAG: hypothetical protein IJ518_02535 [Clostridia bacterium]|nr:hypothetical protein [Clostridia bacterium]